MPGIDQELPEQNYAALASSLRAELDAADAIIRGQARIIAERTAERDQALAIAEDSARECARLHGELEASERRYTVLLADMHDEITQLRTLLGVALAKG